MMAVGAILLLDSGWWALWYQGALYTFAFGGSSALPGAAQEAISVAAIVNNPKASRFFTMRSFR